MIKKAKFKFKHLILMSVAFYCFSIIPALFLTKTSIYQIDNFCYSLNDYNVHLVEKNFVAPYVKIEKFEENNSLYNDIFHEFYYGHDCGSVRQYADNYTTFSIGDEKIESRLYFQDTMSVAESESVEGGFRVDYGLFQAYFSIHDAPLGRKFGCDSFMYISEAFADELLSKYGLEKNNENYLALVKNENYSKITIFVDGKPLTISINNIIYNDKRNAKRISEFNPYFAVVEYRYIKQYCSPCIELDFRAYPHYSTNTINKLNALDYKTDEYSFSFFLFDYENNAYQMSESLNNRFINIYFNDQSKVFMVLYYMMCIIFPIAFFLGILYLRFDDKEIIYLQILEFASLAIYSIICCFIYTHFLFSVIPIALFILSLLKKGGLAYVFIDKIHPRKNLEKQQQQQQQQQQFTEIQI